MVEVEQINQKRSDYVGYVRGKYPRLSGDDAEDLVSDAIERMITTQRSKDVPMLSDDRYFLRVLANTAADLHRTRTGREGQIKQRRSQVEFDSRSHGESVDEFDPPEERVVAASGVGLVSSALVDMRQSPLKYDRLQAELIRLRHCDQLDVQTVMDRLGFSNRKKYESHHARGIQKLRQRISSLGASDGCKACKPLIADSADRSLDAAEVALLEAHMGECVACSMAYWLAKEPNRVLAGITVPALGWFAERHMHVQSVFADRLPTINGSKVGALVGRLSESIARAGEGTSAATKVAVVGCASVVCASGVVEISKRDHSAQSGSAKVVKADKSVVSKDPRVASKSTSVSKAKQTEVIGPNINGSQESSPDRSVRVEPRSVVPDESPRKAKAPDSSKGSDLSSNETQPLKASNEPKVKPKEAASPTPTPSPNSPDPVNQQLPPVPAPPVPSPKQGVQVSSVSSSVSQVQAQNLVPSQLNKTNQTANKVVSSIPVANDLSQVLPLKKG